MDKRQNHNLTPEQYNICFLKGTEPPGSGKFNHFFEPGTYHCVVCDQALFSSNTKYDSKTGWPSFWDESFPNAVTQNLDTSLNTDRIEVTCSNCGSHLGHLFTDGPRDKTGKRYCINSLSLKFVPTQK